MDSKELSISLKVMMILISENRASNKQVPRRKKRKCKLTKLKRVIKQTLLISSTQKKKKRRKCLKIKAKLRERRKIRRKRRIRGQIAMKVTLTNRSKKTPNILRKSKMLKRMCEWKRLPVGPRNMKPWLLGWASMWKIWKLWRKPHRNISSVGQHLKRIRKPSKRLWKFREISLWNLSSSLRCLMFPRRS